MGIQKFFPLINRLHPNPWRENGALGEGFSHKPATAVQEALRGTARVPERDHLSPVESGGCGVEEKTSRDVHPVAGGSRVTGSEGAIGKKAKRW